jgi:hypothetical protein
MFNVLLCAFFCFPLWVGGGLLGVWALSRRVYMGVWASSCRVLVGLGKEEKPGEETRRILTTPA